MSVALVYNGNQLLRVSNSVYFLIHETLHDLLLRKNIINSNIQQLLEITDQEIYGSGAVFADIAEYLKTKEDLLLFAELIREIYNIKFENLHRIPGCFSHVHQFHTRLLEYAEEQS